MSSLIQGETINQTLASAFDDTLGSSGTPSASNTSIGVTKRALAPNHQLSPLQLGLGDSLDLVTVFVDRDAAVVSGSAPDLSAGLRTRYIAASALNDRRHNGTIFVFDAIPTDLVVFSGSRGNSTRLGGTFGAGTMDHFPGEIQIVDVIDFAASPCRGFIDGDTRTLTMLSTTGSFFALDIENSAFVDAVEKTLHMKG